MSERQAETQSDPQPLRLEWSNEAESIALRLQIDGKLKQSISPKAQAEMHQALGEMGHLFFAIANNHKLFIAAGMRPEQVLAIVTEQVIGITHHLADLATGRIETVKAEDEQ